MNIFLTIILVVATFYVIFYTVKLLSTRSRIDICCQLEIPKGSPRTPEIFKMSHCKYVDYLVEQQDKPFVDPW